MFYFVRFEVDMKIIVVVVLFMSFISSCKNNDSIGFDLPDECRGKCEIASGLNGFSDSVINASAAFSNCICLESGTFEGEIRLSKPVRLIGRADGSSRLKSITIANAGETLLSSLRIGGSAVENAAVMVVSSDVTLDRVRIENVTAAALAGGRGITVSGKKSRVELRNSVIDGVEGSGILIDGEHDIRLQNASISNCGFGGVWFQNQDGDQASLVIEKSNIYRTGALSVELLGNIFLGAYGSSFGEVGKRELAGGTAGDGIVIKPGFSAPEEFAELEDIVISGFPRAGMIFDGEELENSVGGVRLKNIRLLSESGSYGIVSQNFAGFTPVVDGDVENPFAGNDAALTSPLPLFDTPLELE